MSVRRRFIVAYDIRDAKRLYKVHRIVKSCGECLQFSVYVADLSLGELAEIKSQLSGVIANDADSVMFFDIGIDTSADNKAVSYLGVKAKGLEDKDFVF